MVENLCGLCAAFRGWDAAFIIRTAPPQINLDKIPISCIIPSSPSPRALPERFDGVMGMRRLAPGVVPKRPSRGVGANGPRDRKVGPWIRTAGHYDPAVVPSPGTGRATGQSTGSGNAGRAGARNPNAWTLGSASMSETAAAGTPVEAGVSSKSSLHVPATGVPATSDSTHKPGPLAREPHARRQPDRSKARQRRAVTLLFMQGRGGETCITILPPPRSPPCPRRSGQNGGRFRAPARG